MVYYTNLVPRKMYTVSGNLVDKSTGKNFMISGNEGTAEITFTPEKQLKNTSVHSLNI